MSDAPPPTRRRSGLDGRTMAIALVAATLAAVLTALAVDALFGDEPEPAVPELRLDEAADSPNDLVGDDVTGAPAPAEGFTTFAGEPAALADYEGTPLVVNFFSTTCAPCVREMPAFEEVHQARDDVAFLGLSVNDTVADGQELIDQTGITYDVGRDPRGDVLGAFESPGMPTTALVRADGTVANVHIGELSAAELDDLIDTHLVS